MRSQIKRAIFLIITVATQSACGGGGGETHVASTPPPAPPAPPTPAPGPLKVFPNVTTSTQFATIGYESGLPVSTGSLTSDGFSVSYDVASNSYIFDVPASQPAPLTVNTVGDRYWNGTLPDQAVGASKVFLNVFRPGPQNWDYSLTYTSFGIYEGRSASGVFAFGSATPSSGVPLTGTATYGAFVRAQADVDYGISGSASLTFDFGAGTLSGTFDPEIYDLLLGSIALGHYDFTNTVYGTGNTAFSGQLASPDVTGLGSFDGQFTGPAAEELMARFTAPFIDPDSKQQKQMFGVWVGKKP